MIATYLGGDPYSDPIQILQELQSKKIITLTIKGEFTSYTESVQILASFCKVIMMCLSLIYISVQVVCCLGRF